MSKAELEKELKNWLTVKQLLEYVRKRYGRHWTRQNLSQLQADFYIHGKKRYSRKPYRFETVKIGMSRLYLKESVDGLLRNLKKQLGKGEKDGRTKE